MYRLTRSLHGVASRSEDGERSRAIGSRVAVFHYVVHGQVSGKEVLVLQVRTLASWPDFRHTSVYYLDVT